MSNYVSLSSLSMDLKRAAMGYYGGSNKMARRFWEEALARRSEIDRTAVPSYVSDLLDSVENVTNSGDNEKVAEDLLLYSILLQNASLKLK